MSRTVWRFIPPFEASGRFQMALDRWLFEQHCRGLHPPTLRFYTWSPVAISLGFHQKHVLEEWRSLHWRGIPVDLVRRPSGGRAVLHQGDLTYAVVASDMPRSRVEAYQKICEFLIQGWRSLGYTLHYGKAGRGYIHNPNCFGTATTADLVLTDGTKLIGSAQLRQDTTILQHGSMRLSPDPELFRLVFGTELAATTFPNSLPVTAVIEALMIAAQTCFGVQLETRSLTETELTIIQKYEAEGSL